MIEERNRNNLDQGWKKSSMIEDEANHAASKPVT